MGTLLRLVLLWHGFFLRRRSRLRHGLVRGLACRRLTWRRLIWRRLGGTPCWLGDFLRNFHRWRHGFLLRCRLDDRAVRRFDPRRFNLWIAARGLGRGCRFWRTGNDLRVVDRP